MKHILMDAKIRFKSNGMSYINVCKTEGLKTAFTISQLLISLSWWISMVAVCDMA